MVGVPTRGSTARGLYIARGVFPSGAKALLVLGLILHVRGVACRGESGEKTGAAPASRPSLGPLLRKRWPTGLGGRRRRLPRPHWLGGVGACTVHPCAQCTWLGHLMGPQVRPWAALATFDRKTTPSPPACPLSPLSTCRTPLLLSAALHGILVVERSVCVSLSLVPLVFGPAGTAVGAPPAGQRPRRKRVVPIHATYRRARQSLSLPASDGLRVALPHPGRSPIPIHVARRTRMSSGPSSPGAADPRPRNHAPATPSGLRQSYTPRNGDGGSQGPIEGSPGAPGTGVDPLRSRTGPGVPVQSSDSSETTSLLGGASSQANHQTFSPRPSSPAGSDPDLESTSVSESEGLLPPGNDASKSSWRTALSSRMKSKKMARAGTLAKAHGFKDSPLMYLSYYIPCLVWMRQYKWAWFRGDLVSALTLASMYLPMALSYADNLAHVPAVHGLYAFVFNPFIYGILGSCPQMVVGPEAAGSLLTGSTVEHYINSGRGGEDDDALHGRIAGVAVGMAGASVFIMGLCRLGFLDSVLSRPFLRGFVSAIGLVIFIDQIVPVLGLSQVQKHTEGIAHGSSVTKIQFLFTRLGDAHRLSAIVGVVSFAVIMVFR